MLRFITPAIYASIFAVAIYFAVSQSPLPQAIASAPHDSRAVLSEVTAPGKVGKRESCRQSVASKSLDRRAARDQMQLCIAKARLECLQQAIDGKVRNSARRAYVKSCVAA